METNIRELGRQLGVAEYRRDAFRSALERIIKSPGRAAEIANEALAAADMVEGAMVRFYRKVDEVESGR